MRCSLPPHHQTLLFSSYEEYEVHYNKTHVNRCIECRKNFPTEHFLNLHIEENHDALISVKRERGEKTYSCFVEDCDKKCSTPQKRRLHLIDKHLFPKDYDFYIINDGIDYRSSLLKSGRQRMRNSAAQQMMDADDKIQGRSSTLESTTEDDSHDIEGLTGAMSALKFVPPSVRFGRGRGGGRGGFSKS
ncbi:hypothetical protein OIDMADRAFT_21229 [Oidiodendron maius Zn]|uniref:C2H2-type domain-containing protein n=1 Tax=Oidiodendron maius (strain Zn) TaxID=913774 RepID=A0A0C3GFN8_OIDMZ|nr:hypothetical protein OIDMADRAFT_21229 [Oidiodendron maius Zn]